MKLNKRLISLFLSICILFLSVIGFATTVYADNIWTYAKDATGFVGELFGLVYDAGSAGYNAAIKIKDDIVDAVLGNPDTDYGVSYNSDDDTFNFRTDENNNVVINQNFYNMAYEKAQNNIYALDGYYLLSPVSNNSWKYFVDMYGFPASKAQTFYSSGKEYYDSSVLSFYSENKFYFLEKKYCNDSKYLYINGYDFYSYDSSNASVTSASFLKYISPGSTGKAYLTLVSNLDALPYLTSGNYQFNGTVPIKLFYSLQDLKNYLNLGKTYIPKINVDISGLKLPQNVLSGNQLSITINEIRDSADKSWGEEQIDIFITRKFQEFLDSLFDSGEPDIPVNPTPTPGFDDGQVTPTPTPPIGGLPDDSSSLLEKIFELLDKFASAFDKYTTAIYKKFEDILSALDDMFTLDSKYVDGFDKFATALSQWMVTHDGKIDTLVDALDKILQGNPSGTEDGCKYDYTVLSDFLKEMWNQSDGKLDEMIKLLEENNEYQKKIVDSLNQIKALLVVDTVMDFFKDRSTQTANKAKEKFPTSIPWDIAAVVNVMCAEPETPVISCPIKIDSLHVDEEIVIDLSGEVWGKLAKTCRSLLSVLFVLYLVHLTRELFFKGGDT